jgi:hypothetical protein
VALAHGYKQATDLEAVESNLFGSPKGLEVRVTRSYMRSGMLKPVHDSRINRTPPFGHICPCMIHG